MQIDVVFLDDNQDLRDLFMTLVESVLEVKCQGFSQFRQFEVQSEDILQSRVVILDLELGYQQPSGVHAFEWLKKNKYQGQVFFLTGHGHLHPLVREATRAGAIVWEKPLHPDVMLSAIRKATENPVSLEQSLLPK